MTKLKVAALDAILAMVPEDSNLDGRTGYEWALKVKGVREIISNMEAHDD